MRDHSNPGPGAHRLPDAGRPGLLASRPASLEAGGTCEHRSCASATRRDPGSARLGDRPLERPRLHPGGGARRRPLGTRPAGGRHLPRARGDRRAARHLPPPRRTRRLRRDHRELPAGRGTGRPGARWARRRWWSRTCPRPRPSARRRGEVGLRSGVFVPLFARGRAVGVLTVGGYEVARVRAGGAAPAGARSAGWWAPRSTTRGCWSACAATWRRCRRCPRSTARSSTTARSRTCCR